MVKKYHQDVEQVAQMFVPLNIRPGLPLISLELSFQCITSVELMKDVQNCVSSEFISFLKTERSDYQTKNL